MQNEDAFDVQDFDDDASRFGVDTLDSNPARKIMTIWEQDPAIEAGCNGPNRPLKMGKISNLHH